VSLAEIEVIAKAGSDSQPPPAALHAGVLQDWPTLTR
jgi:hypothetical protein